MAHGYKNLILAAAAVTAWLLVGTIFYWAIGNCSKVTRLARDGTVIEDFEACPWNLAQAFYFSVQTGMSIGFGLLSESKKASELFSCLHILTGSSFVSGSLCFFASLALTKHQGFLSNSEQRLAKASVALHADGYHGFTLPQIRELMIRHAQYASAVIRKLESDPKLAQERIDRFRAAGREDRKPAADVILTEACARLPEFGHESINMSDLVALDAVHASRVRRATRWARANSQYLALVGIFALWIGIGTLFSVLADENDPITGLYFAVSTLSTAGMVATKSVESNAHVIFVGLYALTGIPIYCLLLGSFANVLVENYMSKQVEETLNARLSTAEVEFLGHLSEADGAEEEVDVAEYTELQLLRLGMVDRETLRKIREQFRKLDTEGTGRLKKSSFLHAHHLDRATPGNPDAASEPDGSWSPQRGGPAAAESSPARCVEVSV